MNVNLENTIYIYTDASFSKPHNLAVIGYAIFDSTRQHETVPISDIQINIFKIEEKNNIRAEISGALVALKASPKNKKIVLYSDCQTTCGLLSRREKLESTDFISQSKGEALANADLYKEFYKLYDLTEPELHWVKGHSKNKLTRVEKNFSYLDKEVRSFLRKTISNGDNT
jgi:ribonuclease HI